ncbi:MAG: tetratricopeptide repeat protein [Candidatus Wallbacteria bacterium]|nr:tetratricopeptide repeat protein [Candidatus Wallbacteria bacterium]
MDTTLENALRLRSEGKLEESRDLLIGLLSNDPRNPALCYQCGWACDCLGLEKEAVPFYENAIRYGLSGADLRGAYLGLGSTLRCLGRYDESLKYLQEGIRHFPEDRALQVFLSLTLYNLNQNNEATRILLLNLIETTGDQNIRSYERALRFYADKLDQKWD